MKRDLDKIRAWQRRSKPLGRAEKPLARRGPIRPMSKAKRAENAERVKLRDQVVGGPCVANLPVCSGVATDWHERLARSQGGSATDLNNAVGLCRPCHEYVTTHPAEGRRLGLVVSPWGKRED